MCVYMLVYLDTHLKYISHCKAIWGQSGGLSLRPSSQSCFQSAERRAEQVPWRMRRPVASVSPSFARSQPMSAPRHAKATRSEGRGTRARFRRALRATTVYTTTRTMMTMAPDDDDGSGPKCQTVASTALASPGLTYRPGIGGMDELLEGPVLVTFRECVRGIAGLVRVENAVVKEG